MSSRESVVDCEVELGCDGSGLCFGCPLWSQEGEVCGFMDAKLTL